MKKTFFGLFAICLTTSCIQRQQNDEINNLISKESVKFIASEYGNALNEYAQVMPIMGQDAESIWAAQIVDSLNNELQQRDCSYVETLSRLAMMETYATYGLGYQIYTFALSFAIQSLWGVESQNNLNIEYSDVDASLRIIQTHDSIYQLIEQSGFTSAPHLFELLYSTDYQKFQFAKYRDILIPENRFDVTKQSRSMEELNLLISLYDAKKWNETDLFRLGTMIEATPYFFGTAMYSQAFASSPESYDRVIKEVINHAEFCDILTEAPLDAAYNNPEKIGLAIDSLLEENHWTYEEMMRQYASHKAGMLRLVVQTLREIRELGLDQ